MEFPAADGGVESRARAGDGQFGRAQARRAIAADRTTFGRTGERGGAAAGCAERGAGPGRRGGAGARGTQRRGHDRLHWLGRGRAAADALFGGEQPQAHQPGTGRQVPADRLRGLSRHGRRRASRGVGRVLQPGRGVHRRLAPAGRGEYRARIHRARARGGKHDRGGRSARSRDALWRDGERGADDGRARKDRTGENLRHAAHGRCAGADRNRRVLRRADRIRGRRPGI